MSRDRTIVFAVVVALIQLSAAARQKPAFRSGTELVTVSVTVTDDGGRFVGRLNAGSFAVYENDHSRPIAQFSADPQPLSLVIGIDTSFSMRGRRFDHALAAVDRLLQSLGPADEVYVLGFSEQPFRIAGWTADRHAVDQALAQIQPDGNTALYDAIAESVNVLAESRNRRQAVVVISDGNDRLTGDYRFDGSHFTPVQQRFLSARALVQQSEALVYTVGIDDSNVGGHDLLDVRGLRQLSAASGAFTQVSRSFNDLPGMVERIVMELRHQYLIGFQPEDLDGKFHRIRVVVNDCTGCVARARVGFIAYPRPR